MIIGWPIVALDIRILARCGKRADSFPWGFYAAPMCETCVGQLELTSFALTPYAQDLFLCLAHPGALSPGVTGQGARVDPHQNTMESLTDPQHQEHQNSPTHQQRCSDLENRLPENNLVCIACGCGDCTVGHWVRWCLIPIASAHRLLGLQEYGGSLDVLAGMSSRNLAICSLVVFHFRRLLRQEGAFFHQTQERPLWWCRSVALWLKLPSRLKSLCRTVNGAKAPSSLVHTGTGPARLQVGWLSCLVFAFFFLSSVVWTHWSTFLL